MTRLATRIVCMMMVLGACVSTLAAQMSERDVRAKLDAVYSGKADEVRAELPALLERYPNDAGVKYIQAVLTADGSLAVKRYEEIAQKYPESVWADDALYKVYQYDFSLGLYQKADEVMNRLRTAYPRSIYVAGAQPSQNADAAPAVQTPPAESKTQKADAAPQVKSPAQTSSSQTLETVRALKRANDAKKSDAASRAKAPATAEQKPDSSTLHHETEAGAYVVQAGLFSTEANATKAAERYTGLAGREAHVKQKQSGEKTMYLVVFEGFATSESAKRFSAELRTQHQIDSFVSPR